MTFPGYRYGQSEAGRRIEAISRIYQTLQLRERFEAAAARLEAQGILLGNHLEEKVLTLRPPPRGSIVHRILHEVAKKHGISIANMVGEVRTAPVVRARHEAMYRAAVEAPMQSLASIGRILCKDHTTVRHGVIVYATQHGLPVPRGMDAERHVKSVEQTRSRARRSRKRRLTSQGAKS